MEQPWQPGATLEQLTQRARLKQLIHRFAAEQNWLEIDPPLLIDADPFELGIDLIETIDPLLHQPGCLHSSPELALKRVLAAYPELPGVYSLTPVFRAGESGQRHNPQFTLFEFYQTGGTFAEIITLTIRLVQKASTMLGTEPPQVVEYDYADLFQQHCQLDVADVYLAPAETLAQHAQACGIHLACGEDLNRDDWLNLMLTHCIEPTFPNNQITVLQGFPASQAAMAQTQTEQIQGITVERACRFEVYIGGMELANGYQELRCASQQTQRIQAVQRDRPTLRTANQSIKRFTQALAHGLPASCGVALGVERLLMWLTQAEHIDQTIAFTHTRR